ncbi:BTAD domain-containing putative transcriptional regulator [Armatimonas sp.]|uniref:ATP-binding protein n=1 Tax=Armatimonas sp. TaxID=1872638 RepID=UPI00286BF9F6|nr:BTAD domain-containing putative transcriptional regulator [Armatimonas sp.]
MLRICLLGSYTVADTEGAAISLSSKAARALLVLLVLAQGEPRERLALAAKLWPEADDSLGLFYLRRTLSELRRGLGLHATRVCTPTAHTLAFATEPTFFCDMLAFDQAISKAAWDDAIALYLGALWPDTDFEWLAQERGLREESLLVALERAAQQARKNGERERAKGYLRQALAREPLRELVVQLLMQVLADEGDLVGARQVFRALRRRLVEARLGEPSAETQEVLNQLERPKSLSLSLSPAPRTLPTPLTRFFGRETECEALVQLLTDPIARLITLTGPGGIGKTRLILEVLHRSLPDHKDLWFIPLAELTEAARLPQVLWQAIAPGEATDDPLRSLIMRLDGINTPLLVLDNFEQLVGKLSLRFLQQLLEAVPSLTCLVTSRRKLQLTGERLLTLTPLAVPEKPGKPERLSEFPSVQFFEDRARAVRPDFQLTEQNMAAIAALCCHTEGVPLALELLTTHLRLLTPETLESYIAGSTFSLLAGSSAALPERHQSVWSAIETTVALLPPGLDRAFFALSTFQGGWTLAAAQALLQLETPIATLLLLEQLEAFSLIHGEGSRFTLLETVREFGAQALTEQEKQELRERHATYFLAWAEQHEPQLAQRQQSLALDSTAADWSNLGLAMAQLVPEKKLRLACFLAIYVIVRSVGLELLTEAHAAGQEADLVGTHTMADLDNRLGAIFAQRRAFALAEEHIHAALRTYQVIADYRKSGMALINLGNIAMEHQDWSKAEQLFTQAVPLLKSAAELRGLSIVMGNLALAALRQGRLEQAATLLHDALALRESLGDLRGIAIVFLIFGELAREREEYVQSQAHYEHALAEFRMLNDQAMLSNAFEGLAELKVAMGEFAAAASYFGGAFHARVAAGMDTASPSEPAINATKAALGDDRFAQLFAEGSGLIEDRSLVL